MKVLIFMRAFGTSKQYVNNCIGINYSAAVGKIRLRKPSSSYKTE